MSTCNIQLTTMNMTFAGLFDNVARHCTPGCSHAFNLKASKINSCSVQILAINTGTDSIIPGLETEF